MFKGQLSGIPFFYLEGSEPAKVSIQFRVGMCDEPAALRGVTHIAEHLALNPIGNSNIRFNAVVGISVVNFYARGSDEELEKFITTVTDGLTDPPIDRLEQERSVLLTEAEGDEPGLVQYLMSLRYGYRTFGAWALPEFGLHTVDAEQLRQWNAKVFTRENCAIAFHGPAQPTWDLNLGNGEFLPLPDPSRIDGLALPAFDAARGGMVAIGMEMPTNWSTVLGLEIACNRLSETLRLRDGVSYSVWSDYERVSVDRAHVTIAADCLDENAESVAKVMCETVEQLASAGPSESELEEAKLNSIRSLDEDDEDEQARLALHRAMANHFFQDDRTDLDDRAEIRDVSSSAVRACFEIGNEESIIIVPHHLGAPSERFVEWEPPSKSVTGERFGTKGLLDRNFAEIGPAGVALEHEGENFSIAADDILVIERDGKHDLTVVASNLSYLSLRKTNFKDPDGVERALSDLAPGGIVTKQKDPLIALQDLVEQTFKRTMLISDEIDALPAVLQPGETVECLASASRGMKAGLLALTTKRLLFIYVGVSKDDFVDIALTDVVGPKLSGMSKTTLRLTAKGESYKFVDLKPKASREKILAQLEHKSSRPRRGITV